MCLRVLCLGIFLIMFYYVVGTVFWLFHGIIWGGKGKNGGSWGKGCFYQKEILWGQIASIQSRMRVLVTEKTYLCHDGLCRIFGKKARWSRKMSYIYALANNWCLLTRGLSCWESANRNYKFEWEFLHWAHRREGGFSCQDPLVMGQTYVDKRGE